MFHELLIDAKIRLQFSCRGISMQRMSRGGGIGGEGKEKERGQRELRLRDTFDGINLAHENIGSCGGDCED